MRNLSRPVRLIALVAGLACLGFPKHLSAGEAMIARAKFAAQFCFDVVEANSVDTALLAKNGYVATNASKTSFIKKELVQAKNLFGQGTKRKVVTGRIQLQIKPIKPGATGTYCKFFMTYSENADFMYLVPELTVSEKDLHLKTLVAVMEKTKKYTGIRNDGGVLFAKGDTRIHYSTYMWIGSTRDFYVLVKRLGS